MQYKVTLVDKKVLPKKAGGTWTKITIKTDKTGDNLFELGYGHSMTLKDTIKVGDMIVGYPEKRPWNKSDGTLGGYNLRINGITAEYVYKLLLNKFPDIEAPEKPKVPGTDMAYPESEYEEQPPF